MDHDDEDDEYQCHWGEGCFYCWEDGAYELVTCDEDDPIFDEDHDDDHSDDDDDDDYEIDIDPEAAAAFMATDFAEGGFDEDMANQILTDEEVWAERGEALAEAMEEDEDFADMVDAAVDSPEALQEWAQDQMWDVMTADEEDI